MISKIEAYLLSKRNESCIQVRSLEYAKKKNFDS